VDKLKDALHALDADHRTKEAMMAVEEAVKKVDTEMRQSGMDEYAKQIDNLKEKFPELTDEMLDNLRVQQQMKKEMDADDALRKEIDALKEEIETMGMSAEQKKLLKLASQGVSTSLIKEYEAARKAKEAMEENDRLTQKASETMKQFATPAEQLETRMNDLQQQLEHGLDFEHYWRAVADATNKYNEAMAKDIDKTTNSLRKFDAAAVGTADAYNRVMDFVEDINQPGKKSFQGMIGLPDRGGGKEYSTETGNPITGANPAELKGVLQKIYDVLEANSRKKPIDLDPSGFDNT
jgi:DNA repair exonuclease SbcCD ATPase subunit